MTLNKDAPAGWFYEDGDPSVGIFGGEWIHTDCPIDPEGYDSKGFFQLDKEVSEPANGVVMISRTLTCADCGQQVTYETSEYVGVD